MTAIRVSSYTHHFAAAIRGLTRYEANDEADARSVGAVRVRAVHDVCVVQRHLARLQDNIDGGGFIHVHSDSLAATVQEIRIVNNLLMVQQPVFM